MRAPLPEVLRLLCSKGRPLLLEHFRTDSCVASAKVAIEVLRYFGHHARPLAVAVTALNPLSAELLAAGMDPEEINRTDGAWSVAVEGSGAYSWSPDRRWTWDGHLVALVEGYLLDLSLDQFARPQFDLNVHAVAIEGEGLEGLVAGRNQFAAPFKGGSLVIYRRIDSEAWRDAPDWKKASHFNPPAGEIIRTIRQELP